MIRNSFFGSFAGCLLALAFGENQAQAQPLGKPFKIVGAGVGPEGLPLPGQPPRFHWAKGVGTDLGIYYGQGTVQTDTASVLPNGDITGTFGSGSPFVFTAQTETNWPAITAAPTSALRSQGLSRWSRCRGLAKEFTLRSSSPSLCPIYPSAPGSLPASPEAGSCMR